MLHLNNKTSLWWIVFIAITVAALVGLALGAHAVHAEGDCPSPNCDDYTIVLESTIPNWNGNPYATKWTYNVVAYGGKDISHVSIGVPSCYAIINGGPGPWVYQIDPTTEILGVHFEEGLDSPGAKEYWFVTETLPGQETRIGDNTAAIKAGNGYCNYPVQGPVCAPNAVILSTIQARVSQPRTWLVVIVFLGAIAGIAVFIKKNF